LLLPCFEHDVGAIRIQVSVFFQVGAHSILLLQ
jgi:hypothetical protein